MPAILLMRRSSWRRGSRASRRSLDPNDACLASSFSLLDSGIVVSTCLSWGVCLYESNIVTTMLDSNFDRQRRTIVGKNL